jgi:hypothetical protein
VTTIFNVLTEEGFDDNNLDYFLRILELLLSHDSGKAAAPESALETLLAPLETGEEGHNLLLLPTYTATKKKHHLPPGQGAKRSTGSNPDLNRGPLAILT